MSLAVKFNVILLAVFALALVPAGIASRALLVRNARDQVLENARIMQETALAVRGYTTQQVKPLLEDKLASVFLPQSVPAFAAMEVFTDLRNKNPDYTYREATLNPTNPRDRMTDWEADVVNAFRGDTRLNEMVGERETPQGPSLYLAHPIQIKDKACLTCHTTPEIAPASMIRRYGPSNGFGWKMGEIIGAQIISVPMSLPMKAASRAFWTFMTLLVIVFAATLVVINLLMYATIVRPLRMLARTADDVSLGRLDVPPVVLRGHDEVAQLAGSLNRMRISVEKALALLDEDKAS